MAKNNKKKQNQSLQALSPKKYLKQRARSLQIGKCYLNDSIKTVGEGNIIVTRKRGENFCVAFFLVDAYCLGIKDSFFNVLVSKEELMDKVEDYGLTECTYEEAHNWIYGAIVFAAEAGIKPHKSFNITQYMLEEDDDNVPLIEYEFGKDGKHLLVAHSQQEANLYLPLLERTLGKGNYDYIINDDDDEDDYDYDDYYEDSDDFDEEDDDEDEESPIDFETLAEMVRKFKDSPLLKDYGPKVVYSYKHPLYPETLNLNHPWLQVELEKTENAQFLKKNLINRILSLPHDELREDLEQMILYHIGQTYETIPYDYGDGFYNGSLSNSMILLGEVGNETTSLDVILEVMRQSNSFFDYHFCDSTSEILLPALYKLGQHQLDRLMAYEKEVGLTSYAKCYVFAAIVQIAHRQPERRNEVLEWFRQMLHFATEHAGDAKAFDCELAGLLVCEVVNMGAVELLPELKSLFDIGYVDEGICGSYESIVHDMNNPSLRINDDCILDIHELYMHLKQFSNLE